MLVSREYYYGLDFLKRNLRLVFKPSMAGELEQASENRSVRHFLSLKEKKRELQAFQARMQNPLIQIEAMKLLRPWIPASVLDGRKELHASFIIFARDARGGYGRPIFDMIYAQELGEEFVPLFAHESFHHIRGKSLAYDEGHVLMPQHLLLLAIDMVQNEGLADQIDKSATLFEGGSRFDSSYARRYRANMTKTPVSWAPSTMILPG